MPRHLGTRPGEHRFGWSTLLTATWVTRRCLPLPRHRAQLRRRFRQGLRRPWRPVSPRQHHVRAAASVRRFQSRDRTCWHFLLVSASRWQWHASRTCAAAGILIFLDRCRTQSWPLLSQHTPSSAPTARPSATSSTPMTPSRNSSPPATCSRTAGAPDDPQRGRAHPSPDTMAT